MPLPILKRDVTERPEVANTKRESVQNACAPDVSRASPSVTDTLELVGKGAVACSLVAYLIGFLVVVPHYARFGVPVAVLSHQTYLITGLSWLVLTGALWVAGRFLRVLLRMTLHPELRRHVLGSLSWVTVPSILVSQTHRTTYLPKLGYAGAVFLYAAIWGDHVPNIEGLTLSTMWSLTHSMFPFIGLIGLFSRYVLPDLPAEYGGAPITELSAIQLEADGKITAVHDSWANIVCRNSIYQLASYAQGCRRIYRVHESAEHLYLLIEERAGVCSSKRHSPEADANTCLVRLAQKEAPRLEMTRSAR